jgi:hypothetical protein
MYKLIAPALLASLVAANAPASGPAAKPAKPLTVQQQKMRDCNAEAKESSLKGPERKAFMKECLKNEGKAAAKSGGGGSEGASSP